MGVSQTKLLDNFVVDSDKKESDFKNKFKKVITTMEVPKDATLEWKRIELNNTNVEKNIESIISAVKYIHSARALDENILLLMPKDKEQEGLTFVAGYFMIITGFSVEQSLRAVRKSVKMDDYKFIPTHVEALSAIRDRSSPKEIRDECMGNYAMNHLTEDVTVIYKLAGFAKPTEQQINLDPGFSAAEQGRKFSDMMRINSEPSSPAIARKKLSNVNVKDLSSLVMVYRDKILTYENINLTDLDVQTAQVKDSQLAAPVKTSEVKDLITLIEQYRDKAMTVEDVRLVANLQTIPKEQKIDAPPSTGGKKSSGNHELHELVSRLSTRDIIMDNDYFVLGLQSDPKPQPTTIPVKPSNRNDIMSKRVEIIWRDTEGKREALSPNTVNVERYLSALSTEERRKKQKNRTGIEIIKRYEQEK